MPRFISPASDEFHNSKFAAYHAKYQQGVSINKKLHENWMQRQKLKTLNNIKQEMSYLSRNFSQVSKKMDNQITDFVNSYDDDALRKKLSRLTKAENKIALRESKSNPRSSNYNRSEIDEILSNGSHFEQAYRKKFIDKKAKTSHNFFSKRRQSHQQPHAQIQFIEKPRIRTSNRKVQRPFKTQINETEKEFGLRDSNPNKSSLGFQGDFETDLKKTQDFIHRIHHQPNYLSKLRRKTDNSANNGKEKTKFFIKTSDRFFSHKDDHFLDTRSLKHKRLHI